MAALGILAQEITDGRDGAFVVITRVNHDGGASHTVNVPEGLANATNQVTIIPEDSSKTAPTVSSVTQLAHPQGATVTFGGGDTGIIRIISLHNGNAAGL
jgi:hypothetical protein